jgi:hypothetical protein
MMPSLIPYLYVVAVLCAIWWVYFREPDEFV